VAISEDEALANLLELNLAREAFNARANPSLKKRKPRRPTPEEVRRAPQMKLPIAGGRKSGVVPQQLTTDDRETPTSAERPRNTKRRAS
jgi:hypothetical protein